MISIDPLLARTRKKNYDCLDFAIEAWTLITGKTDARERLTALSEGVHVEDGHVILAGVPGFKRLEKPLSPCFVVMEKPKTRPHIGVYYDGRVLDLKESVVEYQPVRISKRFFTKIGFYSYE